MGLFKHQLTCVNRGQNSMLKKEKKEDSNKNCLDYFERALLFFTFRIINSLKSQYKKKKRPKEACWHKLGYDLQS